MGVGRGGCGLVAIWQGWLIVYEVAVLARFPAQPWPAGVLVVAAPAADLSALQGRLRSAAADAGGRVETTRDLLAAFHRIENTYLAIFNVLGTRLAILVTLGLSLVVARTLRESAGAV